MPYKDPEKRRAAARQSMAKRAAAKVTARQEKKENVAGGDAKALAWTFIVYPESAPKNWKEVLDGYHIPWVSSPLHDKDINATGEPKTTLAYSPVFCGKEGLQANSEHYGDH